MAKYFLSGTPLEGLEREMMTQPGHGYRRVNPESTTEIRRGYSRNQVQNMEFRCQDYQFPKGVGSFVGELVMKKWGKQRSLICYFDTKDGNAYKLCVWFSYEDERTYRPRQSDLDISMVEIGSILRVEYDESKSGKARWLKAEILEDK